MTTAPPLTSRSHSPPGSMTLRHNRPHPTMTTAPPLISRSRSPPGSMQPRPRLSIKDYFNRPGHHVQETAPTIPSPQSTDAMTAPMGSRMPEPPGRMRRETSARVRQENTDGEGGRNGKQSESQKGTRDEPIPIDLDVKVNGCGDAGKNMNASGDGDDTVERDGGKGSVVVSDRITEGRSNPCLQEGATQQQPQKAGEDTPTDRRVQTAQRLVGGRYRGDDGSSMEKPLLVDEGYGSFSFGTDTHTEREHSNHKFLNDRRRCDLRDELFEDDVEAGKPAVLRTQGERDRKADFEKAEEEAAIEKVNTLFRSHHSRARDWRAEGPTLQVSKHDGHGPASQGTMDNGTRSLLKILTREAKPSMQGAPVAKTQESSQATPVLPQQQAEVEAPKRTAVERSRSAQASNGNNNFRPTTSHKRAEVIKPDPEDDAAGLMLAQERLRADLASRSKAKREREQNRLRKEKEANDRASLVGGPSNAQKAMAADQEKVRKKARPARDDEALMVAETKMIAERWEEERRRKMDADEEARINIFNKLVSLKKKSDDEALRRIERNRIDEERRAKAAERAGRPSVRIKVEDSGSDDAVRSSLARDRAARQAAAERPRSRQAQNRAEEKPKLVEVRSTRTSESGQTSVALRPSASGDEALVGNRVPSIDSIALENELHQANEILQAAQKRVLEVEAEARRVQAKCSAPKRRAEEADGGDFIDQSIHKRARSIEQSVEVNQSMRSSQNPSSVEDIRSPHGARMRARGRPPTKTREERMNRKKETDRRWRLKKQEERKLLKAQSQQEEMNGSIGSHPSKRSSVESEDPSETNSKQRQPMGLRALCASDLTSNAQGLQEENDRAKSGLRLQPFITEDQDERPTRNGNMKTVIPRRDNKAKSNMIRDRAAKDEKIKDIKARLATFQQPLSDQDGDLEQPGTIEHCTADSPTQQERQETVSSDEDEDETQEARTSQPFRLSVPHQPLDMPDEVQPPPPRPTCARKTLPTQTHEIISEEDDSDKDDSSDQEPQPNQLVWGYQVTRKEWLHDEDPNDVGQTTDGPYWSKEQANSIAATEVHQERGTVRILAPMEFNMTIDALGMRTHSICSQGGNIATAVERVLIPPSRANGPMADKAWLPQKLFVALEKVSVSAKATDSSEEGSGANVPRTSPVRVLGLFTVLDLANRQASRCALDHQTSRLGESTLDQVIKAEKGMRARERLQVLDRDSRMFESSCAGSDGSGVVEIWVEEHPVTGPRN